MSAKDRPQSPIPDGYRTLVPGNRVPLPAKPEPKPVATPTAPPAGAKPAAPAKPAQTSPGQTSDEEKPHDDPTRFGDWEVKGRCIDF